MSETIRFSKIGAEDIRFGTGTFEVDLSDGRRATLNEVNFSSFITSGTVDTAVLFTDGTNNVGQDSAFTFDKSTDQLTLGSGGAVRVGSSGTTDPAVQIHAVQSGTETIVRIENSDSGTAADPVLQFVLADVVEWEVRCDDSDADFLKIGTASGITSTPHLMFHSSNTAVYLGTATGTTFNTKGFIVHQQQADDEIITLKSSDIAHGITDVTDTDTYGSIQKANATLGGTAFNGFSEDVTAWGANAYMTTEDTDTLDTAFAAIVMSALKKDGTGTQALGATANLFAVRNLTSSVFLVKGDGDVANSGGSATMTTYDGFDDVKLLQAVKGAMAPNYRATLGAWVDGHTDILERTGVITRGDGNHWFISQRGWRGLLIDAIGQLSRRLDALESGGVVAY